MAVIVPILTKFDASGIKKAQGAFGKLSKIAKFGGAAIAGMGIALAHFGVEAVKAASDGQKIDRKLAQVNKSMALFGKNTSAVTQRLSDYADKTQFAVGVDADIIKSTQTKLLTFAEIAKTADKAGGAFDRATMAAVDLAAAGFGSATGNAVQLGKALNDPIKGISALTKSGVSFTEQEKAKIKTLVKSNKMLDAQDMILKAIEKQVGGTAEASVTPFEKLSLIFGEIKDKVGQKLLPYIEKFSDYMTSFFDKLNDPKSAEAKAFDGLMSGIKETMDTFGNFLGMFDTTGKGNPVVGFMNVMETGLLNISNLMDTITVSYLTAKDMAGSLSKGERNILEAASTRVGITLGGGGFKEISKAMADRRFAQSAAKNMYNIPKVSNNPSAFGAPLYTRDKSTGRVVKQEIKINVKVGAGVSGDAVGREIVRRIKEYEKSNGSGWRRGSL